MQHLTTTRDSKTGEQLKIRTGVRAGGRLLNHNESLRVRTAVRAGGIGTSPGAGGLKNHNEALRVRTSVRAGALAYNHNERGLVGRVARLVSAATLTVALGVAAATPSASAQEMDHGRGGCPRTVRC